MTKNLQRFRYAGKNSGGRAHHAAPLKSGGWANWLLFLKGVDKSNWEMLTMNEPALKKAMDTLEFDEASMIEGALTEGEIVSLAELKLLGEESVR